MKLKKCLAVSGLLFSPVVWTVTTGLAVTHITIILGVLLIPNPVTQFVGSLVFSSLLVNYVNGGFPMGFGFEYLL